MSMAAAARMAAAQGPSDADLHLATCWVSDALEGRPLESGAASMVGRSAWSLRMYALNTSWLWEAWLELLAFVLMLYAFLEPAISLADAPFASCIPPERTPMLTYMQAGEALTIGCFCIDIYAKFIYMGRETYFGKWWHTQYLALVTLLTFDSLLGGTCGQHPFRFLRPMLIFYRNKEQRRILTSLIHLVSHQLGVALLSTIGAVMLAGAVGVHVFGESFDRGVELHLGTEGSADDNHLKGTFSSSLHASLEIWVLISSTENFLDLLLPALRTEDGGHTFAPLLLYFAPVLYLGYFFLMSVLLAVVVDEYLAGARRLVQQEHHRERKALFRAFELLNPTKSGHVDVRTWCRLLIHLRPTMSRQEAILRYHMVAETSPERGVHVREFLRLHANLSVELVEEEQHRHLLRALPSWLRFSLLLANVVCFVAYSPMQTAAFRRLLFTIHTATLPLLFLDRKSWMPSRRGWHIVCLGAALASACVYWYHDAYLGVAPPVASRVAGQLALCLLLVHSSKVLRLIWHLLSHVLPYFLSVSASVMMIVYMFGIVGMQLFHGVKLQSLDHRFAHENLAGCGEPFASLPCTLFITFQVMTMEDWHVILRAMWYSSGGLGLAFVLSFFLVINVCLLSLTTALTINAFLAAKTDLLDQGLLVDTNNDDAAAQQQQQEQEQEQGGGGPLSRAAARHRETQSPPKVPLLRTASAPGDAPHAHRSTGGPRNQDWHQDIHLNEAEDVDNKRLHAAELAMRGHEVLSARAMGRPALSRPIDSEKKGRTQQSKKAQRSPAAVSAAKAAKAYAAPSPSPTKGSSALAAVARAASRLSGGSSPTMGRSGGSPKPGGGGAQREEEARQRLLDEGAQPSDFVEEQPPMIAGAGAVRPGLPRRDSGECVDPRQEKHLPPVSPPNSRRAGGGGGGGGGGASDKGSPSTIVPLAQMPPPQANDKKRRPLDRGGSADSVAAEKANAVGVKAVLDAAAAPTSPAAPRSPPAHKAAHGDVEAGFGGSGGGGGGGGGASEKKSFVAPKQWRVATHAISAFSRSGLGDETQLTEEELKLIAALGG